MGCLAVVAARAAPDLEASRLARSGLRRHDLHEVPHDTETQASRNIDAPAATTRSGEPQHRFQVGAREAGLGAPRACIHQLQDLHRHGFGQRPQPGRRQRSRSHRSGSLGGRGVVPSRGGGRRGVEAAENARPVALERRQDEKARAHTRESRFQVGRVVVSDDPTPAEKLTNLTSPDTEQRPHVVAAPRRHAAEAGDPAASHEVERDALDDVVRRVRGGNEVRIRGNARALEKRIAKLARGRLEGSFRQRFRAPLADQGDAEPRAQLGHLQCDAVRAVAQGVVVVRSHDVAAGFLQRDQERGRVGSARDGDDDTAVWERRDQHSTAASRLLSQSTSDWSSGSSAIPSDSSPCIPRAKRRFASSHWPRAEATADQLISLQASP